MGKVYAGIDIGGTWLKGITFEMEEGMRFSDIRDTIKSKPVLKVKSRLSPLTTPLEFIEALKELLALMLPQGEVVSGIGISTAGVVDYAGKKLVVAANHLSALLDPQWMEYLENRFKVPVTLINDADAASIGAASLGYLSGFKTIGIMPIGTGLGFTVWRNGRKWTPNFSVPLLGCTYTPAGYYDEIVSASELAKFDKANCLVNIFKEVEFKGVRERYIKNLSGIICTSFLLYGTNKILIGGGLADAVTTIEFPLAELLKNELQRENFLSSGGIEIEVMPEGNLIPLIGVGLLAIGEERAQTSRIVRNYADFNTELPYDKTMRLEKSSSENLVRLFWNSEQESGNQLEKSLPSIAAVADSIALNLEKGGRLIYVGAGTSGRLAAIDTVEIACTFGFPRERVLTFISGGVADASIDIETNFEEDASAVPELLLANLTSNDIVIGISVSGSAYFVQSALGFARFVGAYTVMIQEEERETLPFCDRVISLQSGNEVLAGSTRMKAGTATKKVLNFLSTTAMIRMGKVHGCYMTEVECINDKLIKRAQNILHILYGMDEIMAYNALKNNSFALNKTINAIIKSGN